MHSVALNMHHVEEHPLHMGFPVTRSFIPDTAYSGPAEDLQLLAQCGISQDQIMLTSIVKRRQERCNEA